MARIREQDRHLLSYTDLAKALAREVSRLQKSLRMEGLCLPLSAVRSRENVKLAWRAYDLHQQGLSLYQIAKELYSRDNPEDYTTAIKRDLKLCSLWIETLQPRP